MKGRRTGAALFLLSIGLSGPGVGWAAETPATPPAPTGVTEAPIQPSAPEATPARVSYLNGDVGFWRPGAQDWALAKVNTPLAPGDVLFTGPTGNVEIQVGARVFVRAAEGTHIGLDNQEPDFVQVRVTAGHAALDLRELTAGQTVELDTPQGAFTVERTGYYHVDVGQDATTFRTHRGGSATMTPARGNATPIPANQQLVVTGTDAPAMETGAAPQLNAWDRWNYQRTDWLLRPQSARYVAPTVYGAEALDQFGSWRTVETYGAVWVPAGVPVGWVPYSTGRWLWDPRFGWTWLDDAPWGWAPYHYGRWVFVGGYWAWAPGPVVVRPAYAPALVVFLGGGVSVSLGRPLYWAPLSWGEPVIPWWGRPGFVGVAWWGGWGGPRVVNNVVVNRTTNINVTNITVYQNVHVTNAVVGAPVDRFGQGQLQPTRITQAQVQQLTPVHGALEVKPVAASVTPATGPTVKPSAAVQAQSVVATRPPRDVTPILRSQGLATTRAPAAPPRLVPSLSGDRPSPPSPPKVATPQEQAHTASTATGRSPSPRKDTRPAAEIERAKPQPPPPPPAHPGQMSTRSRQTPPPPPGAQNSATQRGHEETRSEPRAKRTTPPPPAPERPEQRQDR